MSHHLGGTHTNTNNGSKPPNNRGGTDTSSERWRSSVTRSWPWPLECRPSLLGWGPGGLQHLAGHSELARGSWKQIQSHMECLGYARPKDFRVRYLKSISLCPKANFETLPGCLAQQRRRNRPVCSDSTIYFLVSYLLWVMSVYRTRVNPTNAPGRRKNRHSLKLTVQKTVENHISSNMNWLKII